MAKRKLNRPEVGAVRVPQCKLCCAEDRVQIERAVLDGLPIGRIMADIPTSAGLNQRNVLEHVRRGHLAPDHAEVARHTAYRTAEIEREIRRLSTDAAKKKVDQALLTLAAGHLRMLDGQLHIDAGHVVAAMRMMHQTERDLRLIAHERALAEIDDDRRVAEILTLFGLIETVAGAQVTGEIIDAAMVCDFGNVLARDSRFAAVVEHPARGQTPPPTWVSPPQAERLLSAARYREAHRRPA